MAKDVSGVVFGNASSVDSADVPIVCFCAKSMVFLNFFLIYGMVSSNFIKHAMSAAVARSIPNKKG